MANDYPVMGPASIDLSTFTAILTAAHSPMAADAPAAYAAIRGYGVDPAVVLAIAQKESSFGKAGIAVGRNNPFGSRFYSGAAKFGATDRGGWAAFPTYAAAAGYTASLLASRANQKGGNTAATFPGWYAPAADHNAPVQYGQQVVAAINRWTGGAPAATVGQAQGQVKAKPAPAPAAKPVSAPSTPTTLPVLSSVSVTGLATVVLAAILVLLVVKR